MAGVSPSAQRALKGRGAFLMHLNGGTSLAVVLFSHVPLTVSNA